MKLLPLCRSRVEASIAVAKIVFQHLQISLPGFARWTAAEWNQAKADDDEIRDCMLGWDVTDFGGSNFENIGRTIFTLRNGNLHDARYFKSYAEKIILFPEGQRAPAHFHRTKREDIINRGGGVVCVQLTSTSIDDQPSVDPLIVVLDGRSQTIASGDIIRLNPGESLCVLPRTIHQFWGDEGTGLRIDGVGYTVGSEVSSVCDDLKDNFFFSDFTRFPRIIEDSPRIHYLCNEYPAATLGR